MKSSDKVGTLLNTKMFRKCINRADVEPVEAMCNVVLNHLSDDALADNNG